MKAIFYLFATLIREILFLSLEDKIHIFKPPCNILYLYQTWWRSEHPDEVGPTKIPVKIIVSLIVCLTHERYYINKETRSGP